MEVNIKGHPCFDPSALHKFGRMHLAVAPKCNIVCNYCERDFHCMNESRPGVCAKVLTPVEALNLAERYAEHSPNLRVIGIAGPGDPLANDETFETFSLLHGRLPGLLKCISTNGLLLAEKSESLHNLGVKSITVTINAVMPSTAARIYSSIILNGKQYHGMEAARTLLMNQMEGLRRVIRKGITVKVNSLLIPGVNDKELPEIANAVKKLGVHIMNIMPLIPLGAFAKHKAPSAEELKAVQRECQRIIRIFRHCQRCRADAVGLIIEKKEVVNNCIRPCTKPSMAAGNI